MIVAFRMPCFSSQTDWDLYFCPRHRPLVYFVGPHRCPRVKIGITGGIKKRLAQLQHGARDDLIVYRVMGGTRQLEQKLHHHFGRDWLEGEWFNFSDEINEFIHGFPVSMVVSARTAERALQADWPFRADPHPDFIRPPPRLQQSSKDLP